MQTVSTDQLVGQNVGNYSVKSLLGRGRLSAVYLAQHPAQRNTVALTTFIMPERFSTDARTRFMQRFIREAAALTALTHRNLLPIHEYGEQLGYPYLITPYMTNGSLADILKRKGRCTPNYVLDVLEQVAAGLEYAHRKGVVHGTLKPSNILLNNDQTLLVAGFGLVHMLQLRGIEPSNQPYAHLLSIADTFLYASTYIAPEVVQGLPIDQRSDIYALGVMLFELLSGEPPFTGSSPLDTAMQHVQRPLPSLHKLSPDVPIAMELVINHALARDPDQRFQRVGELVEAFAQVCRGIVGRPYQQPEHDGTSTVHETTSSDELQDVPEEEVSIGNWQLKPPIITGKSAIIRASTQNGSPRISAKPLAVTTGSWQILPPIVTARLSAVKPETQLPATRPLMQPAAQNAVPAQPLPLVSPVQPVQPALMARSMLGESVTRDTDPMKTPEWWVQASAPSSPVQSVDASRQLPNIDATHFEQGKSRPLHISSKRPRVSARRSRAVSRRNVVALLAVGGVVAAGGLITLNTNLGHLFSHPQSATSTSGKQVQTGGNGGKPTQTGPHGHTGTVVGATSLAANSSMNFMNPANGKPSLLIHLPSGHFVAYDRACTHEGVAVNYDPATHTIICPAHGSVFDPLNNAKVLQGPAATPLANIAIRVNADGTVTTSQVS